MKYLLFIIGIVEVLAWMTFIYLSVPS